jgi:hypothetical protein
MTQRPRPSPQKCGSWQNIEVAPKRKRGRGWLERFQRYGTEPTVAIAGYESVEPVGYRLEKRHHKEGCQQSTTWQSWEERQNGIQSLAYPTVGTDQVGHVGSTRPILRTKGLLGLLTLIGNESDGSRPIRTGQPFDPFLAPYTKSAGSVVNDRTGVGSEYRVVHHHDTKKSQPTTMSRAGTSQLAGN